MKCAVPSCPDARTPGSSYCEKHGPGETRIRTVATVDLGVHHVDTGIVQLFGPSKNGAIVSKGPASLQVLEYTTRRVDDDRVLRQSLTLLFVDSNGEAINDEPVGSLASAIELAGAAYGIRPEDWTLMQER